MADELEPKSKPRQPSELTGGDAAPTTPAQRDGLCLPGTSNPSGQTVKNFHERSWIDKVNQKLQPVVLSLMGTAFIGDAGVSTAEPPTPGTESNAETTRKEMRAKLDTLAEQKIDERAAKAFKNNLDLLEKRMKGKEDEHKIIGNTFAQLSRLFEAKGNERANEEQLHMLAREIAYNAARSEKIAQGNHNTCNAAEIEVRHYILNAGEAAHIPVDLALTGKFVSSFGALEIEPDSGSLKPDNEGQLYPRPDGKRNYASQLYQIGAIQAYYWTGQGFLTRNTMYKQVQADPKIPNDTGERLVTVDKEGKEKETIARDPNMSVGSIARLSRLMTGRNEKMIISNQENELDDIDNSVLVAKDENQLEQILLRAVKGEKYLPEGSKNKEENYVKYRFPLLCIVETIDGRVGSHVVSILDYDPVTRTASVNNTWRSSLDHTGEDGAYSRMPIAVLAVAMRPQKK